MFTRIVMLMLIAVLALPVTTLTRPGETSHSPWGEIAVAARGKKHKNKKDKQPKFTTVNRTVRQPVTQTFASTAPLTIPTSGTADPYPATIGVSGFSNGTITDVNLLLSDLTHTSPNEVDILLSTGDGRSALVMSDVANIAQATDIDLTLDDEAARPLPLHELTNGTFLPTDHNTADNTFPAPAPAPNGTIALSTFDGADPNGAWRLWVMDDTSGDAGDIGGWSLQITAEADVQVQERVPVTKDKHKTKKGKKHKKGRQ
jgi:hypothetical protein